MKTKKIIILAISVSLLILSNFNIAYAQTANENTATDRALNRLNTIGRATGLGSINTSDRNVGIYDKIASVINILLGFVGVVAVIFIIYAGFKWITAGGNEEEITKAKGTIKNAVIGLAIVLFAFVITNFVTKSLIDVIQGNKADVSPLKSCIYLNPSGCVEPVCELTTQSACVNKSNCHTRIPNLNPPKWGEYEQCQF